MGAVAASTFVPRSVPKVGRPKTPAIPEYWRLARSSLSALRPGGYARGRRLRSERDILAITVNRWPHGYAYYYMMLHDPEWPDGQAPHEIGRAQFGRISIANSDAEASPYMDAAIEAGWRAVTEQTL
jgi:spermidine dehydrogenase